MFFREKPKASFDVHNTLVELESKAESLYDLSIVLYASSQLQQDEKDFSPKLQKMRDKLAETSDSSFKAWMLGRLVLAAANRTNEEKVVTENLPFLRKLIAEVTKDESRAWALGYLSAVNPVEFKTNHQTSLDAASALTKPADALWAHVMNLQAAAKAENLAVFNRIIKAMQSFTQQETVGESKEEISEESLANIVVKALAEIPANDWRAWALGIAAEAAATMGNQTLYNKLTAPLAIAISEAIDAKSIANAMMAQISSDKAGRIMSNRNRLVP